MLEVPSFEERAFSCEPKAQSKPKSGSLQEQFYALLNGTVVGRCLSSIGSLRFNEVEHGKGTSARWPRPLTQPAASPAPAMVAPA